MTEKKEKIAFDKLSSTHKIYFQKYLETLNRKKAYKAMKPNAKDSTAYTEGSKLLKNPKIQAALKEYYDDLWENKDDLIGQTLNQLLQMINFDISDYVDDEGNICLDKLKYENSFPIAQINRTISDTKEGQKINESIKVHDKLKAISEITKILGMIQDKISLKVDYDSESVKEIQKLFNERILSKKNN